MSDRQQEQRGARQASGSPPFDFVASKVRPPALRPDSVSRIGLVNRLRTMTASSIVVLAAPAGYGKTTLLAQWAVRDERPFAWVSIDSRDNDPVILLRHLAIALAGVEPIDRSALDALVSRSRPSGGRLCRAWRRRSPRWSAAS